MRTHDIDSYIANLERDNERLRKENEDLRKENVRLLSKWVAAQDLAAQRQLQIMLKE